MKETHPASIQSLKNANLTRFMSRHQSRIRASTSLEELSKRRRFGMPYRAKTLNYKVKNGFLVEIQYRHVNPKKKQSKAE
ncbi:hypothetical protein [Vibrio chagasii]|uniref:hypothetical protein n=1 Tax=Vibrio chagasii TaxID=170679 RepID=UPI0022849AB9|nr:hypothetical protein [Vibrio chagasii]MCY9828820.1 hypothetical protein [Vibrio chagasii]